MVTSQGQLVSQAKRASREALRVRARLEAIRQSQKVVPESAVAFSVAPAVEAILGRSKYLPISSERMFVEYALEFTNGDTDRSGFREAFTQAADALSKVKPLKSKRDIDFVVVDGWRSELRHFLVGVLTPPHGITEEFFMDLETALRSIWILPSLHRAGNGVRVSNTFLLLDWVSFASYFFALLLDESRPHANDLCQCKLEKCERFFLVQKPATGRPQRLYCTREHMLEAHALQSTQRARQSRARKVRKPK